jgi:hypothetical protein
MSLVEDDGRWNCPAFLANPCLEIMSGHHKDCFQLLLLFRTNCQAMLGISPFSVYCTKVHHLGDSVARLFLLQSGTTVFSVMKCLINRDPKKLFKEMKLECRCRLVGPAWKKSITYCGELMDCGAKLQQLLWRSLIATCSGQLL